MNNRLRTLAAISTLCFIVFTGTPSRALDQKNISDIRRADTSEKLVELAEKMLKDDASRKPKDFEEGTQIATEMNAYLLYIQVRQNDMVLQMLQALLDKQQDLEDEE